MTYQPTPAQQQVIDADDPVLLVLGGAGTGKTSTAAAAVRACLERRDLEDGERAREPPVTGAVPVVLPRGGRPDPRPHRRHPGHVPGPGGDHHVPRVRVEPDRAVRVRRRAARAGAGHRSRAQAVPARRSHPVQGHGAARAAAVPGARHRGAPAVPLVPDRVRRIPGHRRRPVPAAHRHPRRRAAAAARRPEPVHLLQPARRGRGRAGAARRRAGPARSTPDHPARGISPRPDRGPARRRGGDPGPRLQPRRGHRGDGQRAAAGPRRTRSSRTRRQPSRR